jgi:hypothetical protein
MTCLSGIVGEQLTVLTDPKRAKPYRSLQGNYSSCSDVVGQAMSGDVMQSVAHLIPDILEHIHVLLYQVSLVRARARREGQKYPEGNDA